MKYAWVELYRDTFPVARLCRLLGVSRSGYCQWRTRPRSARAGANAVLDVHVASIHAQSDQTYGRSRIVEQLQKKTARTSVTSESGKACCDKGCVRYTSAPFRVTTDSALVQPIALNVLKRRFDGWQPNQAGLRT